MMKNSPSKQISSLALVLIGTLFLARAGTAQEPEGEFIDGEYVEGYAYVPDFMPPEELKRLIDEHSEDILILDTAADLIYEEEHIPGAVNFPWVHELALPVKLPRDKTLVIYCACNDHEDSVDMAKKLSQVGYLDVKVLEGGWFEWLDLEYDTAGLAAQEGQ